MIVGELLEGFSRQPVNPGIADMENMRRGGPDHHGAERANVTSILVISILALLGLRMQPRIGGGDNALCRYFHGPGIRRAVIVRQKALDRGFTGHAADGTAADAIGDYDGDPFQAQQRLVGNQDSVEILIYLLSASVGVLTDRYCELAWHTGTGQKQ